MYICIYMYTYTCTYKEKATNFYIYILTCLVHMYSNLILCIYMYMLFKQLLRLQYLTKIMPHINFFLYILIYLRWIFFFCLFISHFV